MKKIINAILLAVILFIILNFLYSNMTMEVLGYPMVFRFDVPGLFILRSVEMPLGFVLVVSFSAGILFLAFLQLIPIVFKNKAAKEQQKRIKELEKELTKSHTHPEQDVLASSSQS